MRKLVLACGAILGTLQCADTLTIVSPPDGATVPSAFVAIEAEAATPGACFEIVLDDRRIAETCADPAGHVEAVIRVEQGSHVFRLAGEERHIVANPPAIPAHAEAPWELLREGDVILSRSVESIQKSLYNPRYTHAAIYLGPGRDGAALIAEAVVEQYAAGLGEIRALPVEQALPWREGESVGIFRLRGGLSPAERKDLTRFLRGVVNRGLKFWSPFEEFSSLYAVWFQWDQRRDRPLNEARFQAALDRFKAQKLSPDRFNCATLIWRAYWEASNGRVDLGDPNRIQFAAGSPISFTPAFLERMRPYLLGPDTFYLRPARKGDSYEMTRLLLLTGMAIAAIVCFAWQSNEPPPAIAQNGVVNSASFMPSVFGSGAVARGSLFTIRGYRLGPEAPGVSVEVHAGTARVQALPVKVAAGEIEAVMPADAPLGDAELIVRKQDDPSLPFRIRIVESSFGAYSRNRLGWGPAEARNGPASPSAQENSPDHPAQPGQTITMTGTGFGATDVGLAISVAVGGKTVTRIRHAGRNGMDELSFDLPADTPEGCYVPVRVQSAPGIVSNTVTISVRRGAGPCEDPGAWLPRRLDRIRRVGVAGLIHADVLLLVEDQKENFRFDAGFAKFFTTPPGQSWTSPFYQFPPYGSCTTYNRIARGDEILSAFASMGGVPGTPMDAGQALMASSGGVRRSIGLYRPNQGAFAAVLGGRSPFPGAEQFPLFLRPRSYEIAGTGGEVGPFRAPVGVSKFVRWDDRARVTTVDRSRGVTVHWTPADPRDSIVITALNLDSRTGAMGICECLAQGRARRFTIPAAALANIPLNQEAGSIPLNLLVITEFPGQAPEPFTAPGLDRAFAFFLSSSARSVEYR